jgi:hypothetical protein
MSDNGNDGGVSQADSQLPTSVPDSVATPPDAAGTGLAQADSQLPVQVPNSPLSEPSIAGLPFIDSTFFQPGTQLEISVPDSAATPPDAARAGLTQADSQLSVQVLDSSLSEPSTPESSLIDSDPSEADAQLPTSVPDSTATPDVGSSGLVQAYSQLPMQLLNSSLSDPSTTRPVLNNGLASGLSEAAAQLPTSVPISAATPPGAAATGLLQTNSQLPIQDPSFSVSELSTSDLFSVPNHDIPSDLIGSVTLPSQAGHMSLQAFNNLPDVIDTSSLDLIPKNNATLLGQHIASFGGNQSGPSFSQGTTLPDSASPQALLAANLGHH